MSQWIDRVRNHAVWTLLASLDPLIEKALERDAITAEAIDSLERLKAVLMFCGKRIIAADPVLVASAALDTLNATLTQFKAHVEAFISNGDIGQLNAANSYADAVLNNFAVLLSTETSADLTAISEAAASYRTTLETHLKKAIEVQQQLAEKNAANETKISAIEAALDVEQKRLAVLVTEQQSQFSASQDKRASDFAASQAEFLAKYTTATTEQQTQFSTDQDLRRTAYSEFQRESLQKLTGLMAEYDQKLKDHDTEFLNKEKQADDTHNANLEILHSKYKSSADEILVEMRRNKAEVESLVGVIGNLGVTSGYKKVADHARTLLYIWQGVTVAALVGLVAVAFLIAFPNAFSSMFPKEKNINAAVDAAVQIQRVQPVSERQEIAKIVIDKSADAPKIDPKLSAVSPSGSTSDTDFYHGLVTRIFLSLTFGIFAAYAGRQASHFFTIEQRNRKLALELEALGPFIEPLGKEDRDKFRVQIGDRSFGVPDHEALKPKEDDPVNLMGLLKSKDIQDIIAGIVKEVQKGLK